MVYCDFSAVMQVLRRYLREGVKGSQTEFVGQLFHALLYHPDTRGYALDEGQVCRWLKGQTRVSPVISRFYAQEEGKEKLRGDVMARLLPQLCDVGQAVQELYQLLWGDFTISSHKKMELTRGAPFESLEQMGNFVADLVLFALDRPFFEKKKLGQRESPTLLAHPHIPGHQVPPPCRWFCGREREKEAIGQRLEQEGILFLTGIPGIGKSELAKAVAWERGYTNRIYLPCGGSLKGDIAALHFVEDLPGEPEEHRFLRHQQFLQMLGEESLLVVDNLSSLPEEDPYFQTLCHYRCHVLVTTRLHLEEVPCYPVGELSMDHLLQLVTWFYPEGAQDPKGLRRLIERVHRHTYAAELVGKLLTCRKQTPMELYARWKVEHLWKTIGEKIRGTKDGATQRETYYRHISALFALFRLDRQEQTILRGLALTPADRHPIDPRLVACWLRLDSLNPLQNLIDLGLVECNRVDTLQLPKMLKDVIAADLEPSVHNCRTMLQELDWICRCHGLEVSDHRVLFDTIEEILQTIQVDDRSYFLRFLENCYPYMEKYDDYTGVEHIRDKLAELLRDDTVGEVRDRALLLDCNAMLMEREGNIEEACRLTEQAIALLPETVEYGQLLSNLHFNLGCKYKQMGDRQRAKEEMCYGASLLEQCEMMGSHDGLLQIMGYAQLQIEDGAHEETIPKLLPLVQMLKKYQLESSQDAAQLYWLLALAYEKSGRPQQAAEYRARLQAIQGCP